MSSSEPARSREENLARIIARFNEIKARESKSEAGAGEGVGFESPALPLPPWQDPSGKDFALRYINGKPVFFIANSAEGTEHNVIPIAIEMYFQTQRYVKGLLENSENYPFLTAKVFQKINLQIQADYRAYLEANPAHQTIPEINTFLDQQRLSYMTQMLSILEEETQHLTSPRFRADWAHYLTEHTAGPITVVEENPNGSLTVIEMCEQSSHSKKTADPAIVPMKSYSAEGELQSTHFRCPSLVGSERLPVVEQINLLMQRRAALPEFSSVVPTGSGAGAGGTSVDQEIATRRAALTSAPPPMIYNLLTSFVGEKADLGNNQSKTADGIFRAAHDYNRAHSHPIQPLFLPMNLPMNQLTRDLRVDDPRTSEALFLSHLAVANSTLKELSELISRKFSGTYPGRQAQEVLERIARLNRLYQEFLISGEPKISTWTRGKEEFIAEIEKLKESASDLIARFEGKTSVPTELKLQVALIKLFYSKYTPEASDGDEKPCAPDQKIYGAVIQAMHLATSSGNVAGCKSANDRFGLIWNMVESLKDPSPALLTALDKFLSNSLDPHGAHEFAEAVYQHANQRNIFGAGHMPSIVDVGPPKYRESDNPKDSLDVGGTKLFGTGLRVSGVKSFDLPPIFSHMKCKNAGKVQFHLRTGLRAWAKNFLKDQIKKTFDFSVTDGLSDSSSVSSTDSSRDPGKDLAKERRLPPAIGPTLLWSRASKAASLEGGGATEAKAFSKGPWTEHEI